MAKLYLEVYERHKAAFLNDSFTDEDISIGDPIEYLELLKSGRTFKRVWDVKFTVNVSTTSQILSALGGNYLTKSAEQVMKKSFRILIQTLEIYEKSNLNKLHQEGV